ncbi:MAG: LysR family transcriptional regulator [Myxococcota bacterium]|nr:LysR family transcriptional regulator [Myxococcota bacterium]
MHGMHISGIDMNLALVLHALLEERSVSRAGKRLALSQSATSHALARLRHLLGDPLFVRTPRGLVPTARAEAMAGTLASALSAIESTFFAPIGFDPLTARRTFRIGSSDYAEHIIMPVLMGKLASAGPNMDIWARSPPADDGLALANAELDLMIAPPEIYAGRAGVRSVDLWRDEFVVVMRKGHPLARRRLTVARYAEAQHAFIAPSGRPGGAVDDALAKVGRSRHIAFTTANFLVAPQVVAKTDLIITLASRIARVFMRRLPLVQVPPPVALPGFRVAMVWHERTDTDPAHRFLREQLVQAAAGLTD